MIPKNAALVGAQVRGIKGWMQELRGSLGYSESGRREAQEGAAAESTEHSLNQERSPGLIKGDGKARIYNVG